MRESVNENICKSYKKLYWLGILGMIGIFLDHPVLKWFSLFFLFGIVDAILLFYFVLRTETNNGTVDNLKFLLQNLGMLLGIPIIYLRIASHKTEYRIRFR